jgi:hypothetical protein
MGIDRKSKYCFFAPRAAITYAGTFATNESKGELMATFAPGLVIPPPTLRMAIVRVRNIPDQAAKTRRFVLH